MHEKIKYNPKNSYRVEDKTGYKRYWEEGGEWMITIYKGATKEREETKTVELNWDELPQWLKDKIMLLQLASKQERANIPFIGERIIGTYWIMAQHLQNDEGRD